MYVLELVMAGKHWYFTGRLDENNNIDPSPYFSQSPHLIKVYKRAAYAVAVREEFGVDLANIVPMDNVCPHRS